MRVSIDQAGDDSTTLGIYRLCIRRSREIGANSHDAIPLNEQVHIAPDAPGITEEISRSPNE
jgi:hypothetical protein